MFFEVYNNANLRNPIDKNKCHWECFHLAQLHLSDTMDRTMINASYGIRPGVLTSVYTDCQHTQFSHPIRKKNIKPAHKGVRRRFKCGDPK